MWCHLCTQDYSDFEEFRNHIIQVHRNSEVKKESSESEESERENTKVSETDHDDENTSDNIPALFTSSKNCSDESESDVNMSVLNASTTKNDEDNKSDVNTSVLNASARKYDHKDSGADVNTSVLNNSVRKSNVNKKKCRINRAALNHLSKKLKKSLKKRGRKNKKKVVFCKKVKHKHRKCAASYKEESSELSEENETYNSENSFKGKVKQESVDCNPALNNNCINSQSVLSNNYVISQPTSSNNPMFLVNPYVGQDTNNYVTGYQAVQPPMYVVNPVNTKPVASKNIKTFDFTSKNIQKWLAKHKELCKNIPFPLTKSLFKQVNTVRLGIFYRYCAASSSEECSSVMKVYEELDCMIHKQVNSRNNAMCVV